MKRSDQEGKITNAAGRGHATPRIHDDYYNRTIVAGGPADPVAFTRTKHDWIAATLAHLDLADEQPRRLYQEDLDPTAPNRRA